MRGEIGEVGEDYRVLLQYRYIAESDGRVGYLCCVVLQGRKTCGFGASRDGSVGGLTGVGVLG